MRFYLWSVALAAALIYLPYLVVATGRVKVGYDLSAPRRMLDRLPGWAQRATWAHQNALESFPIFAAAVFAAMLARVPEAQATLPLGLYLGARTLYPLFYILDWPLPRAAMFASGSAAIALLFVDAIQAAG